MQGVPFSNNFRRKAVRLGNQIGDAKAAKQMKCSFQAISHWRIKAKEERKRSVAATVHETPKAVYAIRQEPLYLELTIRGPSNKLSSILNFIQRNHS